MVGDVVLLVSSFGDWLGGCGVVIVVLNWRDVSVIVYWEIMGVSVLL